MFSKHIFYFKHLEQSLKTFIINHRLFMGENGKIYHKLHILLFFIKRDINIDLVQDRT
jgi:hypothetical protein